jgi:threonine/homoserine/homoserine lactone efflux protein
LALAEVGFFFKGIVIGFSIAAPVGPIGLLCIRRSLAEGRKAGLVTGLGAASADAIYGCIAAFGLTAVSAFLVAQKFWLGLIGGCFLCYLGLRAFLSKPDERSAEKIGTGLAAAYFSTFLLTLTNPATILSFLAVFAGMGLVTSRAYSSAGALVGGVFLGSALWWLLLSGGVGLFRSRVGAGTMQVINRVSGVLLFALGLYALSTVLP